MKHRRTIRLQEYDYSWPGAYFVTLAVKDRRAVFGQIISSGVQLNKAGQIAKQCWEDIPNHFPQVELDAYIVMPNHLHGIVCIKNEEVVQDDVGARHATLRKPRTPQSKRPRGTPRGSLGAIIGSYKSSVSRRLGAKLWQRNYFERVIRDERELQEARNYIQHNALKHGNT